MTTRLCIIVALDENGVIGKDNELPWHLPPDLKHFKQTTMDKPLVMGRRTHQSIGKPLPGRHNIVITRRPSTVAEGCTAVASFEQALRAAGPVPEVMVIGGASVYEQALPRTDRIYQTRIHAEFDGDTRFPDLRPGYWRVVRRAGPLSDGGSGLSYSFVTLDRKRPSHLDSKPSGVDGED